MMVYKLEYQKKIIEKNSQILVINKVVVYLHPKNTDMTASKITIETVHPGITLKNELKKKSIKQKDFAEMIGMHQSHLSEIIKGKRNISDSIAKSIADTLGMDPIEWIELQARYDLMTKKIGLLDENEIEARNRLHEYEGIYDMKRLFKAIGMSKCSDSEKYDFCKEVLEFESPSNQNNYVKGLFRRSTITGQDKIMIATWTVVAKYEASKQPKPTEDFNPERMDELAEELREIFNDNQNTLNRVERKLDEYGIRFRVVPKLDRASIDGFSFIADSIPSIVITKRFNRIDNIAFAVMHEVGHLKLHLIDGSGKLNIPQYDGDDVTKAEEDANRYASDALIPKDIWETAPEVKLNPFIIQKEYTRWAQAHGINKWIALGRVSHETGIYKFKQDPSREIN